MRTRAGRTPVDDCWFMVLAAWLVLMPACELLPDEDLIEMTNAGEVKVTLLGNEGPSSTLYLYRPVQVQVFASSSGKEGQTFSAGSYPAGTGIAFMVETSGQTVNTIDNPEHFLIEESDVDFWRISCDDAASHDEDFDDLTFEVKVE